MCCADVVLDHNRVRVNACSLVGALGGHLGVRRDLITSLALSRSLYFAIDKVKLGVFVTIK